MPELPEVETIRTQLEKYLVGHRIEKIDIRVSKIFAVGKEKLISGKIKGTRRFGKVLVVDLDNGYSFLVHLKLTGQLIYSSLKMPNKPNKFTHVVFILDRGARLFYNDSRKFGWIRVCSTLGVEHETFIGKLGPSPFELAASEFIQILSTSSRPAKVLLLDQSKLSGVGNIYANDALWEARIDPRRPAKSLNQKERLKLFAAVKKVLQAGLKYQGASDQWYLTAEGKKGAYQEHFLAYGRTGKLCSRCKKEKIKKIALAGRGTYFCSHCQK